MYPESILELSGYYLGSLTRWTLPIYLNIVLIPDEGTVLQLNSNLKVLGRNCAKYLAFQTVTYVIPSYWILEKNIVLLEVTIISLCNVQSITLLKSQLHMLSRLIFS